MMHCSAWRCECRLPMACGRPFFCLDLQWCALGWVRIGGSRTAPFCCLLLAALNKGIPLPTVY